MRISLNITPKSVCAKYAHMTLNDCHMFRFGTYAASYFHFGNNSQKGYLLLFFVIFD